MVEFYRGLRRMRAFGEAGSLRSYDVWISHQLRAREGPVPDGRLCNPTHCQQGSSCRQRKPHENSCRGAGCSWGFKRICRAYLDTTVWFLGDARSRCLAARQDWKRNKLHSLDPVPSVSPSPGYGFRPEDRISERSKSGAQDCDAV
jgi:hypothetical protein